MAATILADRFGMFWKEFCAVGALQRLRLNAFNHGMFMQTGNQPGFFQSSRKLFVTDQCRPPSCQVSYGLLYCQAFHATSRVNDRKC